MGIVLKSADVIDLEPETIQLVDDVKCIVSLRTVVITGGELGVSGLANETLPDQLDIGNGVLDVALYSKQVTFSPFPARRLLTWTPLPFQLASLTQGFQVQAFLTRCCRCWIWRALRDM